MYDEGWYALQLVAGPGCQPHRAHIQRLINAAA